MLAKKLAMQATLFVCIVTDAPLAAQGQTPAPLDRRLITAIKRNDIIAVRNLLSRGANPNAHTYGTADIPDAQLPTEIRLRWRRVGALPPSALMLALELWAKDDPRHTETQSLHRRIVKVLLGRGANVNEAEPDRNSTPLMFAVLAGDAETVNLLLRHGANVNARDKKGATALMIALAGADRDRSPIIRLLLDCGADPDVMMDGGYRPLTLATGPERLRYVRLLVNHGANINAADRNGVTILARLKADQRSSGIVSDNVVDFLRKRGAHE